MKPKPVTRYIKTNQDHPPGLSEFNFARFSTLISNYTGLNITPSKRTSIESKLRKRAAKLGCDNIKEYAEMVFEKGGLKSELDIIIDIATTNKTDFFRESSHFKLLESALIPNILKSRPRSMIPHLKVWSAASSNGAEAFTIAIILSEIAAHKERFDFSILGSDISSEMIVEARRAIYPAAMIEHVPEELKHRYFMRSREKSTPRRVRITPEIRKNVKFKKVNLIRNTLSVDKDIDIIFLRNVLIYFDMITQKKVVQRVAEHLRPSGYLILGHTEAAIGNELGFEQIGTGVFCVK